MLPSSLVYGLTPDVTPRKCGYMILPSSTRGNQLSQLPDLINVLQRTSCGCARYILAISTAPVTPGVTC
jgi:hypothetical protein